MLKKINRLTNEILDLTDKLSMGYIMCRDEYSRLNRKLIDNFKVLHLKIQKLNKMKILYYKQKYKLKTIWDGKYVFCVKEDFIDLQQSLYIFGTSELKTIEKFVERFFYSLT